MSHGTFGNMLVGLYLTKGIQQLTNEHGQSNRTGYEQVDPP